jgi:O-antigen/teichoic acid export membrane protein
MYKAREQSISSVLIWQIFGRFILQGISFFTIPIFTRLLTASDYGKVAVYTAWVSFFSLIVGLQTYGSIGNARIKYNDKINSYLSCIITISITSFILILLIVVVFIRQLSYLLDLREDLVILLVVQSFASFCISFYTAKLVQYKQAVSNIVLSLAVSLSSTFLSMLFLVFSSSNVKYASKIYANAIPIIITGIIIICYIYIKGKKIYDRQYWKYCLFLTLPLIFHGTGGLILVQSDRILLQRFIGEEVAGIYSFAYNMAMVVQIIWGSFNTSWIPFYFDYKKNKRNKDIIFHSRNYVITFSIIVMGFILLSPEVYKIMAPQEYWQGIQLIPLIVSAYYLNFLYGFPANFEFFHEKTYLISIGTISAAVINIGLNIVFIPKYGGTGAAITTLISYVFLFTFHEIIARFIVKNFEYDFKIYLIGIIPVSIVIILFYFFQNNRFIRWGIGVILGIYLLRRIIKYRAIF